MEATKFNPREHLMNLKGKEYLQVMWRLVWFREEKPSWCIDTKAEQITDASAVFTAKIYDENGLLKASGYGSETKKDFNDFIEKAETKSIGRALAMLGYGTQFAPELDEGDRIVDSPVGKTTPPVNGQDLPPYEPKGSKQEHVGMASKAQLESIQLAAGGDLGLVKKGIAVFGYKSGKEVQAKDVDGILDIIGQMIVTGND